MRHRPSRLLITSACLFVFTVASAASSKPPKFVMSERNATQGISGQASSAQHCLGNTATATGVHQIGAVPNGSRLTVTFSSSFDPVAAVTITQLGSDAPQQEARITYVFDDDTGGNLEPELRLTTSHDGMAVLYVSRFEAGNTSACYFYKVEVQTP